MRTRTLLVLGIVAAVLAAGCGGDDDDQAQEETEVKAGVFVGAVALSRDRVAIALGEPNAEGTQSLEAFITDGTADGDAEWFEGTATDGTFDLTSVDGSAQLVGTVEPDQADGRVTLPDGAERRFHTIPATQGAGIYEVTVDQNGSYTGISESGAQLKGQQNGDFVEGTITTPVGDAIRFRDADLTRVFDDPTPGGQPGTYTVILSCSGLTQVGRGGDVKGGSPDAKTISLDLGASQTPTPGVYYGKVAGSSDQFALVVDDPDNTGPKRVRVVLSDGEPEPEGDIQWFTGDVNGDAFDLTSASNDAKLTGRIAPDGVTGQVTLPGGQPRPVFAVPAGDGAGIYDVTVNDQGGYEGTSEQGGKLTLQQQGPSVTGTITAADGRQIPLTAYDLTRVFEYSVVGSPPDKYVALASPSGRYLVGRSGDVRGGAAGTNMIAVDQAC